MTRVRRFIKICLILLIIQSVSCDWMPNNKEKETLCKTTECKARGEEYKKNRNAKTHPCQDFYTFSCGNWQDNHPGPKYVSTWNILDVMDIDFFMRIRKILESYKFQQGDDITFIQAKMIYESCTKIPQYAIREAKDIAREVTKVGRVPKTSLWDIHFKYLHLSGESSLFGFNIMANQIPNDLPVLMVLEPHSAYGSISHEEIWQPQEKQAYTDFLFLIMKSLKLKDSDAIIKERIDKVFYFREKLNKIIQENAKRIPDDFEPLTGQELDNWLSLTIRQISNTQDILWTEVIDALLEHVPADLRRTRKIIAVRQKQYFLDLMNLLKRTSEEVLASHMEIYFVESHLKLNENMYKLLEGTSVKVPSLYRYIRDKYYPRWYTCIEELNMKDTLEKLVYRKWFLKDYAKIVHAMNSRIKVAIEDQIKNSSWLDKKTREETANKIKNVEEWIGFPPWIDGNGTSTIERNQDIILTAQASLYCDSNLLYVRAPLLLPPMFNPAIPNVYNYAGIGATVGHELYHVINDCGQYWSQSKRVVWWDPAMRAECRKKRSLFINMYNRITDREFKNRYNISVTSDTSSSFLENYPDVMGLEAAYNAFEHLANIDKSVCQTLPNFEKYSCDQMFYIAFANTYCGYYTKKKAESKLLEKSRHSLDSIRINGAVAQMESFSRAFGCPVGSPMNPVAKLNLWK